MTDPSVPSTTASDLSAGPLDGVRVLELGSFIAGPFAGQLLGDYGADVIKIEAPGDGDPMRRWGVTRDGDSLWWPAIARNKRSVVLDLRDERARQLVRQLAERCDVVLENFRPGVLDRWGLGYQALAAANPRLVLVHISGFGQTGPLAGQAGFGSVGEAMGGIRHTTGSPDRPPSRRASASATRWRRCSASSGPCPRCWPPGRPASARRSTWRSTRRSRR